MQETWIEFQTASVGAWPKVVTGIWGVNHQMGALSVYLSASQINK